MPAIGLSVPASRAGVWGRPAAAVVGQGPPPGAALSAKESVSVRLGAGALQGISAVVVWVAQVGGVCSEARLPPKSLILACSRGSSGFSSSGW